MKHPYNTYPQVGLNDYVMTCQICGIPWPATAMKKLPKYTGNDGLLVCPNDYDKVHFGYVPYKIRAERPVRTASMNDLVSDVLPNATYPGDINTIQNCYNLSPDQLKYDTTAIQDLDDEIISLSDNYKISGEY